MNKYLNIARPFKKHENIFDGKLGNYTSTEYKIELLGGAQPYYDKPVSIPKVQKETLKTEVDRLVNLGVLNHKNKSKWKAPTFIIP